eukprot:TRINITY_DN1424_c0_g1_i4.p1 TRINITY_DN1424_c0_g1~~TRINITY_DN1424_c0_g1_i4.p1  ORF type:complete len:1266 (+),score=216.74 TRINITY_DN1424_c0_g1_i4:80-3877(+)
MRICQVLSTLAVATALHAPTLENQTGTAEVSAFSKAANEGITRRSAATLKSEDLASCCGTARTYGVVPTRSWGTTPTDLKLWWESQNCSTLVGGFTLHKCIQLTETEKQAQLLDSTVDSSQASSGEVPPSILSVARVAVASAVRKKIPLDEIEACCEVASEFSVTPGETWGSITEAKKAWWKEKQCSSTVGGNLLPKCMDVWTDKCCEQAKRHKVTPSRGWGDATEALKKWWDKQQCSGLVGGADLKTCKVRDARKCCKMSEKYDHKPNTPWGNKETPKDWSLRSCDTVIGGSLLSKCIQFKDKPSLVEQQSIEDEDEMFTAMLSSAKKAEEAAKYQVVPFRSLIKKGQVTVIHLTGDRSDVVAAKNIGALSVMAETRGEASFLSVLRFMSYDDEPTQFRCSKRIGKYQTNPGWCKSDGGEVLDSVRKKLPPNSSLQVVQDMYKIPDRLITMEPTLTGCPESCFGKTCGERVMKGESCRRLEDRGCTCEGCKFNLNNESSDCLKANPLTHKVVPTLPKCNKFQCGALWNVFGSDGGAATQNRLKESVIVYGKGGCVVKAFLGNAKRWSTEVEEEIKHAIVVASKRPPPLKGFANVCKPNPEEHRWVRLGEFPEAPKMQHPKVGQNANNDIMSTKDRFPPGPAADVPGARVGMPKGPAPHVVRPRGPVPGMTGDQPEVQRLGPVPEMMGDQPGVHQPGPVPEMMGDQPGVHQPGPVPEMMGNGPGVPMSLVAKEHAVRGPSVAELGVSVVRPEVHGPSAAALGVPAVPPAAFGWGQPTGQAPVATSNPAGINLFSVPPAAQASEVSEEHQDTSHERRLPITEQALRPGNFAQDTDSQDHKTLSLIPPAVARPVLSGAGTASVEGVKNEMESVQPRPGPRGTLSTVGDALVAVIAQEESAVQKLKKDIVDKAKTLSKIDAVNKELEQSLRTLGSLPSRTDMVTQAVAQRIAQQAPPPPAEAVAQRIAQQTPPPPAEVAAAPGVPAVPPAAPTAKVAPKAPVATVNALAAALGVPVVPPAAPTAKPAPKAPVSPVVAPVPAGVSETHGSDNRDLEDRRDPEGRRGPDQIPNPMLAEVPHSGMTEARQTLSPTQQSRAGGVKVQRASPKEKHRTKAAQAQEGALPSKAHPSLSALDKGIVRAVEAQQALPTSPSAEQIMRELNPTQALPTSPSAEQIMRELNPTQALPTSPSAEQIMRTLKPKKANKRRSQRIVSQVLPVAEEQEVPRSADETGHKVKSEADGDYEYMERPAKMVRPQKASATRSVKPP